MAVADHPSASSRSAPDPGASPAGRRVLLVDADAFFVAVARMEDPDGAGRASLLIVGGAPGSRGVVCSASYEARAYGVRSAMPIAQALRLCPRAVAVPVPRGACSRKSREIRAVLAHHAPVVQPASIDEWYLDLTGTERLYRDASLADIARRIRDDVRAETGLTVSIGGGRNKLIAKLAVEHAKPKPDNGGPGVHVVAPGEEAAFLRGIALGDIPMVGPRFRDRLHALGLRTVADVLMAGLPTLHRVLGERAAHWLYDRARGIDDGVVEGREHPRSVSHEDTFRLDLTSDEAIEHELVRLVTKVASDLRARGLSARTVNVKLRDGDFRTRRASRTFGAPVVSDRVILATAHELLARLRRARRAPARLLGVSLSGLTDGEVESQLSLFTDAPGAEGVETARDRALTAAVDSLRARFGADAVVPGALASKDRRGRGQRR